MKFEVEIKGDTVSGAFVHKHKDKSLLSLYINTKERWVDCTSTMSGGRVVDGRLSGYQLVFYFGEGLEDYVKFTALDADAEKALSGNRFKSHCKNQIHILIVAWDKFDD